MSFGEISTAEQGAVHLDRAQIKAREISPGQDQPDMPMVMMTRGDPPSNSPAKTVLRIFEGDTGKYHRKEDLKRPLRCGHRHKAGGNGMADQREFKIGVLAGDGIGPEITDATIEVLHSATERTGLKLRLTHCLVGWKAREQEGTPLSGATEQS